MRLIFLDIDGVLVSGKHMDHLATIGESAWKKFDPECVSVFNELIERTNAKVVITSTWRYHYETLDELAHELRARGVNAEIVAMTKRLYGPSAFSKDREDEILEFLYSNTPVFGVQWLALDDAPFKKIKRDHTVQTDFNVGLDKTCLAVAMSKWGRQEMSMMLAKGA